MRAETIMLLQRLCSCDSGLDCTVYLTLGCSNDIGTIYVHCILTGMH